MPVDSAITLCVEQDSPCLELVVDGDGYSSAPGTPQDQSGRVRFAPLTQRAGRQVFILEVWPEGSGGYLYLIARRHPSPIIDRSSLQLASPDCIDLKDSAVVAFESVGGEISRGMISTCLAPNLDVLRTAFLTTYGPDMGNDSWWNTMSER